MSTSNDGPLIWCGASYVSEWFVDQQLTSFKILTPRSIHHSEYLSERRAYLVMVHSFCTSYDSELTPLWTTCRLFHSETLALRKSTSFLDYLRNTFYAADQHAGLKLSDSNLPPTAPSSCIVYRTAEPHKALIRGIMVLIITIGALTTP